MKKILLTGGAGFIGSHLTKALLAEGHQIVCLDNFNDYYDPAIKRGNVTPFISDSSYKLVEGDILKLGLLREIFQEYKFDIVVHLAARAGVRPSLAEPLLYQEVNVQGTTNLLEVSKDFALEKFIFGSSSSVYGENKKVPFSEGDVVDFPISPYAATKKAGELICFTYHHLYQLPVTCLRFFTVYGPRQRPDMAIHKFTKLISQDREISMYGAGDSRRDYTYVSDIVDGILKAIENCESYHIYNLGESKTIDLRSLIHLIADGLGKDARIKQVPMQPGDVPITYASIDKARNEIGYNPNIDIESGIRKFVDWFLETAA